jgi:6-pyruvoyltetrahydropterin/6-carboxytetrahydropterin synthase
MITRLGMEFTVDYAHSLPGHILCGREHGHTATILIEIEGEVKGGPRYQDNMLMDFSDMKRICKEVLDRIDHRNTNELFDMPTSEVIAKWIYQQLVGKIPIAKVTFYEGKGKWCEVST